MDTAVGIKVFEDSHPGQRCSECKAMEVSRKEPDTVKFKDAKDFVGPIALCESAVQGVPVVANSKIKPRNGPHKIANANGSN